MKIMNRRFTLIELLVVLAIIALLMSMLYPTFARARELSRAVVCGSNEMQIGVANTRYVLDHKGQVLPYCSGGYAYGQTESWDLIVFRYLQNYQPMQCPADNASLKLDVAEVGSQLFRSYSITGSFCDQYHGWGPTDARYRTSRRLSTITNPGLTISFMERTNWANITNGEWRYCGWIGGTLNLPWFHRDLTPTLFADGHMSLVKKTNGPPPAAGARNDPTPIPLPGYGYDLVNGAYLGYGAPLPE